MIKYTSSSDYFKFELILIVNSQNVPANVILWYFCSGIFIKIRLNNYENRYFSPLDIKLL